MLRCDHAASGCAAEGSRSSQHGLPSAAARGDSTQWAWGYNDRGEVTSGGKKFSDGSAQPSFMLKDKNIGIGEFMEPGGTIDFHGSKILASDDARPNPEDDMQALSDETGIAIEAGEGYCEYWVMGYFPRQIGRHRFVPKSMKNKPEPRAGQPCVPCE